MNNTQKSPAARREKLQRQVREAHDWLEGQTYGGNGTQLSSTDVCQICGLTRHYFSDTQNGNDGQLTYSAEGANITLIEAAKKGCA